MDKMAAGTSGDSMTAAEDMNTGYSDVLCPVPWQRACISVQFSQMNSHGRMAQV